MYNVDRKMKHQVGIDREARDPAYMQLVNLLKQQISKGVFYPGGRLPSESELCSRYQVSPMTVRRSIKILLDQKIVTTVRGGGTYVRTPNLGGVTFSMEEFYNMFSDKERTKVKILETLIVEADEATADKLAIGVGDKAILIRRVLNRDGDPIIYHRELLIYDPLRPIVEAELEVTSLDGLFVGTGETRLKSGRLTIKAAVLSTEEADVLNAVPMQPAFRLEHIFFDFDDRPVSWGWFICRGDRLAFNATIGASI